MHYLHHYPQLILLYGPLRYVWCMRFEGKHQYFKSIARITRNFVNITQTLSKRHQMRQCYEAQSSIDLGYSVPTATKTKTFVTLPPALRETIKSYLDAEIDDTEVVAQVKTLKKHSVLYRVGMLYAIALLHGEGIPLFFEIYFILSIWNLWILCGKLHRPTRFLSHEHSFAVDETNDWHTCRPGSEIDHTPINKYTNSKGNNTVLLKYRISANKNEAHYARSIRTSPLFSHTLCACVCNDAVMAQ